MSYSVTAWSLKELFNYDNHERCYKHKYIAESVNIHVILEGKNIFVTSGIKESLLYIFAKKKEYEIYFNDGL